MHSSSVALVLLVGALVLSSDLDAQQSFDDRPVIVADATDSQQQALDEALLAFERAELALPPLKVIFGEYASSTCDGYAALYQPARSGRSRDEIAVCNPHPMVILHELAHAWEHHFATDAQREAFMRQWGATEWNDPSRRWEDRPSEIAAEIIALSLYRGGYFQGETVSAAKSSWQPSTELSCNFALLTQDQHGLFSDCVDLASTS